MKWALAAQIALYLLGWTHNNPVVLGLSVFLGMVAGTAWALSRLWREG